MSENHEETTVLNHSYPSGAENCRKEKQSRGETDPQKVRAN